MQTYVQVILVLLLLISGKPHIQDNGPWSEWTSYPCYKGIDVRWRSVKSYNSKKDHWDFQLRSRYETPLYLDYSIKEDRGTSGRGFLKPNKNHNVIFTFVQKGIIPTIIINKVRFGKNDTGEYYGCDNVQQLHFNK